MGRTVFYRKHQRRWQHLTRSGGTTIKTLRRTEQPKTVSDQRRTHKRDIVRTKLQKMSRGGHRKRASLSSLEDDLKNLNTSLYHGEIVKCRRHSDPPFLRQAKGYHYIFDILFDSLSCDSQLVIKRTFCDCTTEICTEPIEWESINRRSLSDSIVHWIMSLSDLGKSFR